MGELNTRLQNAINEINAAMALPIDTGDVVALRAQIILLRGTLRGIYEQAQAMQNAQFASNAEKAEDAWKKINNATVNYSAPTQVIIGENVNIPIPDMFQ